MSGSIPLSRSARSIPTWTAPRLPPPARIKAVFERAASMAGLMRHADPSEGISAMCPSPVPTAVPPSRPQLAAWVPEHMTFSQVPPVIRVPPLEFENSDMFAAAEIGIVS
jgi:hypothetical protein